MSIAPTKPGISTALALRHRFGARLMLAVLALATALFWAVVIRLLLAA
jgi:hypothetical protein